MRTDLIAVILIAAFLLILIFYFVTAKGERKKVTLINSDGSEVSVYVEIANTSVTRAKGLMGRTNLSEDEGMLFIFDTPGAYPFWMFNTSIPLEAIHMSENGTVVDIIEMDPCGLNITQCKTYPSSAVAKYVLEVNQNFSKIHGIAIDSTRLDISQ